MSFFTPTFKDIGATLNLQDVKCVQTNGSEWARSGKSAIKCNGLVSLQKTDADGNFLTNYQYFSTDSDIGAGNPSGWYYSDKGVRTYADGVTFSQGEGMIVQNNHSAGANFVISGEVDLAPALILPKGVSFSGNFTPVDMDLQDIQCVQTNGTAWARSGKSAVKCNGLVSLQKTDADGNFLTNYQYFSTDSDIGAGNPSGWYYSDGGVRTYATGVTFKSGEGFIIQNNHSVGAKLVLKSPIGE